MQARSRGRARFAVALVVLLSLLLFAERSSTVDELRRQLKEQAQLISQLKEQRAQEGKVVQRQERQRQECDRERHELAQALQSLMAEATSLHHECGASIAARSSTALGGVGGDGDGVGVGDGGANRTAPRAARQEAARFVILAPTAVARGLSHSLGRVPGVALLRQPEHLDERFCDVDDADYLSQTLRQQWRPARADAAAAPRLVGALLELHRPISRLLQRRLQAPFGQLAPRSGCHVVVVLGDAVVRPALEMALDAEAARGAEAVTNLPPARLQEAVTNLLLQRVRLKAFAAKVPPPLLTLLQAPARGDDDERARAQLRRVLEHACPVAVVPACEQAALAAHAAALRLSEATEDERAAPPPRLAVSRLTNLAQLEEHARALLATVSPEDAQLLEWPSELRIKPPPPPSEGTDAKTET